MKDDIKKERRAWIDFWSEYVKKTPNSVWSKQQAFLINSLIDNWKRAGLTREDYLKMKGEKDFKNKA